MRKNKFLVKIYFSFLIFSLNLLFLKPLAAFNDEKVHPLINTYSVNQSILAPNSENYLTNMLGFYDGLDEEFKNLKIIKWIEQGGEDEDWFWRPLGHFNDPLKPWESAGLLIGESTVYWAQRYPGNNYSWQAARSYFYTALTASDTGISEENWANTFKTTDPGGCLGQSAFGFGLKIRI